MAERKERKPRRVTRLSVLRTWWLTPKMIRVVAGGEGIAGFTDNGFADQYVKVLFPKPEVDYPEPFDMDVIHRDLPRDQWPPLRTYTVRGFDADAGELTLDFVVHGDEGLAGPWAANARPGDDLLLLGPGGEYAPRDDVDWHLLVGDESALPAIANALERLPEGVPAHVFIEVTDATDELRLDTRADAHVTWFHRSAVEPGEALVAAVRDLAFPTGRMQAFVHGEAGFFRALRGYLFTELNLDRALVSISGYWRRGKTDEGWREEKAAERRATEAA